jgi:hypothetical protein
MQCSLKRVEIDVRLVPPLFLLSAALSIACGRASADDCHAAVEHYLDLAVRETPGGPRLSPAQAAAVKDVERGLKRAEPTFRRVQDRCESVGRAEAACAAKAETTAAWEACLGTRDGG